MIFIGFVSVLTLLALHYAWAMVQIACGFRRVIHQTGTDQCSSKPFVSVLVPARNEAVHITSCIQAIRANTYPADRFEILVIDDGSDDNTASIVRRLRSESDKASAELHLLSIQYSGLEARGHKKRALNAAIARAQGEVILTTDADCLVPPAWIESMIGTFTDEAAFVSGPVLYRAGTTRFGKMQALEFLGLIAIGAGSIGRGRPNMCNGANVAYRRKVYNEVGGFTGIDHVTSGDDELLMQKIAYASPHQVRFCPRLDAVVLTDPVLDLRSFFEQRRRWASKGMHYPNRPLVGMITGFYFFYLMLLIGAVAAWFVPGLWLPLLIAFMIKIGSEWTLMGPATRHFGQQRLMRYFVPEQLAQIPYVVVMGLAGTLGHYSWKGRHIRR